MAHVYIDDTPAGPKWCVAAKKKLGNAVKRNRAKRLLREYIHYLREKIDKKKIFIVAKEKMLNITFDELKKSLDKSIGNEFNE